MLKPAPETSCEIECPLCRSNVSLSEFKIDENNLKFLLDHSAGGTLDEALTILRLIIEKVPGIKIDVSNETALKGYFEKMQDQISRFVVTPAASLVESANEVMVRLSELADRVPSGIRSEFKEVSEEIAQKLMIMEKRQQDFAEKVPRSIESEFGKVSREVVAKLKDMEIRLCELSQKVPSSIQREFVEISRELNEKIRGIQRDSTETPLMLLKDSLNPILGKLEQLTEKVPEKIRDEFKEVKKGLQDQLAEVRNSAEKSNMAVSFEVKSLNSNLNALMNKPAAHGRAGEGALAELWVAEFSLDVVDQMGASGEPDMVILPCLSSNGGEYGRKISLERKSGSQKYSGQHAEQACRHAKKVGANQVLLVYDSKINLLEEFRPLKIVYKPQQKLTLAICSIEEKGWVTARQIFEVLQAVNPPDVKPEKSVNLAELDRAIADLQAINATIDKLRKFNNAAIRSCEGTRGALEGLEDSIFSYQNRLRQALSTDNIERIGEI